MAEQTEKKQAPAKAEGGGHITPPRESRHCREKDCKVPYRAKGYCVKHYRMWRQGKLGTKQRYKICAKEACRKPMVRWGLCDEHYKAAQSGAEAGGAPAA